MKKIRNVQEVPSYFRCPISFEVMEDPVILSSGITYERASIEKWLRAGNNACPVTRQVLHTSELIPNHTLSQLIRSWCTNNTYITASIRPISELEEEVSVRKNMHELSSCPLDHHVWSRAVKSDKLWNGLVTCLKAQEDACQGLQEEALAVMTNIYQLGTVERRSVSTDELCTIATFLRGSSKGLRIKATRLLLCMATSPDEELRVKVGALEGLVEGLVEVLRNKEDDEAALKCMVSVCTSLPQVVVSRKRLLQAIECGATGVVARLLTRQQQLEEQALELLKTMATCAEGRESLAKDHTTTVPAILECLLCTRNMSRVATEHGIVTLWYLFCHSGCSVDVEKSFIQAGGLSTMIMVLHCDCSTFTKQRAGELLKHFSWLWK